MDNIEATRARKKTNAEWESHRTTIQETYRTKQLEGDDGLIDFMRRQHNFKAR
jgi:hypothetical protein